MIKSDLQQQRKSRLRQQSAFLISNQPKVQAMNTHNTYSYRQADLSYQDKQLVFQP